MTEEKRQFTRIVFDKAISLQPDNGICVQGQVDNICMKGAFVLCDQFSRFTVGEHVSYTMTLSDPAGVAITGDARVVWIDEHRQGCGLFFFEMDIDSFTNLKRLVELNFGDADIIEKELEHCIQ